MAALSKKTTDRKNYIIIICKPKNITINYLIKREKCRSSKRCTDIYKH